MQIVKVIKNWIWKSSDEAGNQAKDAWQEGSSSVSNIGIKSQNGGSWIKKGLPLLLILAVGFWAVSYLTGSNPLSGLWSKSDVSMQTLEANVGGVTESTSEIANPTIESEKASWIKISLPNGEDVEFEENSFGHNITTWLANDDEVGTKTFTWNNINWQDGSTELPKESLIQLSRIALVLNEYSWGQMVIEGHTDSDGNAAANKLLSQQRVDSTKEWLVTIANLDATRIESQGWGSEKWDTNSDNVEEWKNNWKMDFIITKK